MVEYSSNEYHLPPPYFPVVIGDDDLTYNPLLKSIAEKQSEIIKVLNSRGYGCNFKADASIEMIEADGDITIESAFIEYAIANNLKLKAVDFTGGARAYDYYRDAIKEKLAGLVDIERLNKMIEQNDISDAYAVLRAIIQKSADFIDLSGVEDILLGDFLPDVIANAFKEATKVESPEPTENPDDIVAIGGDTKKWMVNIKQIALMKGGDKYKWDGKNKVWNVKRSTWNAIIGTKYEQDLELRPATITHW